MNVRIAVLLVCAGWAANGSAQTAVNCPTQPPQLNAPANNAANVASPVHFDWNDVTNANSYRVWASFTGGTPNIIALTRDSEASISVPAGIVEWWVDALADGCSTFTTSAHFRFTAVGGTMNCPQNPSSPALLTPANTSVSLASPVTLSWTAVPNATGYRVFAQVNGAPAVVIGTTTSTQLSAPFPASNVIWFVEAQFGACPSTFSRFGTFTVTTGASCSNVPAIPVAPGNGATVTAPVTFRWTAVPGATSYKLFIGSDLVGTTSDTTLTKLLADGTFTWYVVTTFASCPDQQSIQFRLTVPPPTTCSGSITLTAPAENATVASPVNLTWTPVPGATAYRIWVSIDGSAPTILARSVSTTQSLFTPSGNVTWFVEALFAQCQSILSPTGHFTVGRGATCGVNIAPIPTSPINGTQVQSPVTFNWSGANSAMLFRVWVSVNGAPFEDVGITKDPQLKTDVPGGNVQWYVEAFFNGCPSVNSSTARFTIPQTPGCANDTSILISPADGSSAVTAPVTLVWSAVDNVTNYRVFATLNGSAATVIARTAGTSVTKSLPPGSITWWVEAEFDSCPSTKSLRSNFVIPRSTTCGTDVPQLVSPPDAANNLVSPV
ncbi:MAG: hypothetical protein M3041_20565, partial [Acidobacteriota bacterium]|nr:hypothetical protein [Acidobacteriota bacterium]